ncbi:amidohydrolase [Streptomyces sp. NBC_01003]|uniref:amidohydrolase n=1 Tax=Streptomyces sp. NBC_01003 TaxID=2903714 RepID=UPI00386CAF94
MACLTPQDETAFRAAMGRAILPTNPAKEPAWAPTLPPGPLKAPPSPRCSPAWTDNSPDSWPCTRTCKPTPSCPSRSSVRRRPSPTGCAPGLAGHREHRRHGRHRRHRRRRRPGQWRGRPVVLLRADMDALLVKEETGLPYASTATGTDPDGNEVPVMHACGHDMHVACLLGATAQLAAHRESWQGTVLAVFQPAEEVGGAPLVIDDGFRDRFPRPDVCLGQHVPPAPAGLIATRPGPTMAASDSLKVTLFGRGGHGSAPETTIDPVVRTAAVVMRLQTVVSREIGASHTAVVTVGSLHAGTKENVIPDTAELKINVRSTTRRGRVSRVLDRK